MWWETIPGLLVLWAAALSGLLYLASRLWRALRFTQQVSAAVGRLILIGTTDRWPNGAKDLPDAMNEIYIRQGQTHELLESYIVAHRTDHQLPGAPR
jgi:hypothetical protein